MIKKDAIFGVVLNILIISAVVGIRYYYAQQEMDFLTKDSGRQEGLITVNKLSI
jgi:hypothetical protein